MKKKLDLPFEYFFLPKDTPSFVKTGSILTILDFVGVVLCTDGSIELTNDVGTYKVNQGELFFYMPSAFLHIGDISQNFKCIVLKTTMGYVLPIVNRALDIRTQLYLRSHPPGDTQPGTSRKHPPTAHLHARTDGDRGQRRHSGQSTNHPHRTHQVDC
jgi:hypothetical protein